jgi:hypothetical protein
VKCKQTASIPTLADWKNQIGFSKEGLATPMQVSEKARKGSHKSKQAFYAIAGRPWSVGDAVITCNK